MNDQPTFIGSIQDVNGTQISVELQNETLTGLVYVNGQGYRIGQIGSFVRIPIGYLDLFGIVSQIGASAVPEKLAEDRPFGFGWMTIQLVGEGLRKGNFKRGISQYPTIGDEVHLVSKDNLEKIYGHHDRPYFVDIGNISGSDSIPALIDVNKLVTRHSAVVGTTGSGKSTTVASLLDSLSNNKKYPSARILVIDLHGEYGNALKEKANVYKVNPDSNSKLDEKPLHIPYWAMNFDELMDVTLGELTSDNDYGAAIEKILELKKEALQENSIEGVKKENTTVDTPVPFSLNKFWYDYYCQMFGTYYKRDGSDPENNENWAFEKDADGVLLKGNIDDAIPPKFRALKNVAGDEEKIHQIPSTLNFRRQITNLGSKLRDPRFDFLFRPGKWTPDKSGKIEQDLDTLFEDWIGGNKSITILDLSGVPGVILKTILGTLLRIIYDGLFWARKLSEGGIERPLLIVLEEAHTYLDSKYSNIATQIVQRIVKEGRKYGIGAMIVSQRPSEINQTILSQCGTFFALRLSNSTDRSHVASVVSDSFESLISMLPILKTGEAIVLGESVKIPMRTNIRPPKKENLPDSQDPVIFEERPIEDQLFPGGWGKPLENNSNYKEFIQVWRLQNPNSPSWLYQDKEILKRRKIFNLINGLIQWKERQ